MASEKVQKDLLIRVIRISAIALFAFGVAIFTDFGGVATELGLTDEGLNQIMGGAFMMVAVIDIVVVPRILLAALEKKKKQ